MKYKRKPWLAKAIIKAIIAALVPVAGLIAAHINSVYKLFMPWIWLAYGLSVVFSFVYEFIASEKTKQESPHTSCTIDRSLSIGGNANRSNVNTGDNNQQINADNNQGIVAGRDVNLYLVSTDIPLSSFHQLPPAPRDFTGRVVEKDELLEKAKSGGVTICGLKGEGGVGKTALALVIAHELAGQYPDGQLYIDLKGVDKQPITTREAMSHFIRSWHPDAKLPDDEVELKNVYLSVLHDKKAILLLDNAKDAEQVMPLLPPKSCLAIVTSRQHFELPGWHCKRLDMLLPEDARNLVLKIAPRIGDRADDLAKVCGYLPLALRLAASALASRADLTPAEYMDRLNDAKARLELIDASLSLSYDLLTPDQQRVWRILGVFQSSFDVKAAAAVWEIDEKTARDTLGELYLRSMLEIESEGRYKLHDLSRVYALSKLDSTELSSAECLHAQYYVFLARITNQLYNQGGESVIKGLALFDFERVNIEAGQKWSAERAPSDNLAADICIGYALAAADILILRLYPEERLRWFSSALEAAQHLKNEQYASAILENMGLAYTRLGKYNRAIECHEQSLAIEHKLGNRLGEGKSLGNLGNAYFSLGDYYRAIEFFEQSLAIMREIGDRRGEGYALGNLGNAYYALSDYRALDFYEQSLDIAREIGDRVSEGNALGGLGNVFFALHKYDRAVEFHEQKLAISREIGDRVNESISLGNLGNAYCALGKYDQAIEFHMQSLAIKRELNDRKGEGTTLGNLGILYNSLGEYDRSIEFYSKSLTILQEIGDRMGESTAFWNISIVLHKLGKLKQAIVNAKSALEIFEQIKSPYADIVRAKIAEWESRSER